MIKSKLQITIFLCSLLLILFLASCAALRPAATAPAEIQPTPTSNYLFSDPEQAILVESVDNPAASGAPTVASFFEVVPTNTPRPTFTPALTAEETPIRIGILENEPLTVTLFTDTLNPNWRIASSRRAVTDAEATDFVHSGENSVAVTFNEDFETVYFAVSPDSEETYLRDNVLAVSFWLNGGKDSIATDELGVTVFGSNDYPYWVAGDNSVTNVIDPVFQETRLYFLGINRTIPPDTWVRIDVWLDDQIFDPLYSYFTGFYIKNDEGFHSTIYIDDVSLLVLEDVLRTPRKDTPEPHAPVGTVDSGGGIGETGTPTPTTTGTLLPDPLENTAIPLSP